MHCSQVKEDEAAKNPGGHWLRHLPVGLCRYLMSQEMQKSALLMHLVQLFEHLLQTPVDASTKKPEVERHEEQASLSS
jgi:hypothetical protein